MQAAGQSSLADLKWPRGFAVLCLLWGLLPNPYIYYVFLRFVVCGVCGYTAYRYAQGGSRVSWVWLFGALAVLYNPILPLYLTREIWTPVDLATAALLLWSLFRGRMKGPRVS